MEYDLIHKIQKPGWGLSLSPVALIINAPSQEEAQEFYRQSIQQLAQSAAKLKRLAALIRYPECHRPYRIPAKMSYTTGDDRMSTTNIVLPTTNGRPNLADATRRQVFDFIEEQRESGKIIMVASQITDRCVDVQCVSRERGIFAYASQWHGYNFWELWRETIDQYFRLRQLLDSDGYISGYVYEILRIDGSKARYKKDYYLANNFLPGEPVRISVAERQDWELIRPAVG